MRVLLLDPLHDFRFGGCKFSIKGRHCPKILRLISKHRGPRMRITNDCSPEEMLAELFNKAGDSIEATAGFGDPSLSNHDYVCEQLSLRVAAMLRSYERLGNNVHITQSMRDNGVDIYLEFENPDQSTRRIGIQVKGNREAVDAVRKNRIGEAMEATLKRQAFEANRWRLHEWWVVLCFDVTQTAHAKLVKRINSELLQGGNPAVIRIYEPIGAWNFLRMGEEEVDAMCVRKLCREDEVLVAAQAEVNDLSLGAYAVVMPTLFGSLEESADLSLRDLMGLVNEGNDADIDRASDAIDELEQVGYLERHDHEDTWSTHPAHFPGLCALYFEGRVRHRLSPSAAADFVTSLAPPGVSGEA
jgi:hypothetical protein